MSLTGALSSAISALSAQSQSLSMISDNIANTRHDGLQDDVGDVRRPGDRVEQRDLLCLGRRHRFGPRQHHPAGPAGGDHQRHRRRDPGLGLLRREQCRRPAAPRPIPATAPSRPTTPAISRTTAAIWRDGAPMRTATSSAMNRRATSRPINTQVASTSGSATTKTTIAANLPSDAATGDTYHQLDDRLRFARCRELDAGHLDQDRRPTPGARASPIRPRRRTPRPRHGTSLGHDRHHFQQRRLARRAPAKPADRRGDGLDRRCSGQHDRAQSRHRRQAPTA